jgi:DNA-binding MarR family transcriptional regulator
MEKEELQKEFCRCLYYSAAALGRCMSRMADDAFAPTGLSPSHAFLLMSVNMRPGIQPMQLSQQMMLDPSTITRLIERMESEGYLERKKEGKLVHVYPAKKGRKKNNQIRKSWLQLKEAYSQKIGLEKSAQLTSLAYEAVANLEA